jgi:hypothetical protein
MTASPTLPPTSTPTATRTATPTRTRTPTVPVRHDYLPLILRSAG